MEIDLTGQGALVLAHNGPFVGPLQAALAANGASVLVRDPAASEPKSVLAEMLKTAGRLDVLVLVSPTLGAQGQGDSSASGAAAAAGDLDAYAHAASAALAETGGCIVVIGSALGLLPSRRNPLGGLADAVLFQLVRETAMRLGSRKVRINGLALGAIGGTTASTLRVGDEPFLTHTALKGPGTIADVTNAILFLADPENTYMTGHILTVDGGWTAGFARDF